LIFANRSDTPFAGVISGTGSVQQNGTGITVLTGNSTYTGGTTINAGTLQLGNGGTTGNIVGNVIDKGILTFDRSDVLTFGGTISGTGSVQQNGTGTTILIGNNTYTGVTTISAGTLRLETVEPPGASVKVSSTTGHWSLIGATLSLLTGRLARKFRHGSKKVAKSFS
jgi:autotransporter-associated beta strand protein